MRAILDLTPLVGRRTGVAYVCQGFLQGLMTWSDVEVEGYVLSARRPWAGRKFAPTRQRFPMPAGILMNCWARGNWPKFETFVTATQARTVVHGTNFVVPPVRHGGTLVTVHDVTPFRNPLLASPATHRYWELLRRAVGRGAHVHCVSRATAQQLVELLTIPDGHLHVIHPGFSAPSLDRSTYEQLTASSRVTDEPYILALGTILPRKNYPSLVRAFDRLHALHPKLRLIIAGAPETGSAALQEAIAASPARSRIAVVGQLSRTRLLQTLAGATALAYPSLDEGFGLPPLEAMAANVPVVATRLPALEEVCGEAAEYSTPDDEALAEALGRVIEDSALREKLTRLGRARVRMFSWERATKEMSKLYERIAE